ncbi:site-2 protease family protein [Ornithinimicrobium cavernae]|uniref:site-2 protease family protein n=1 Tax=Ornithinimicrobium cavernae TaxID=2666047 RepID=UPI000D699804|nr:site-2 protease family protein [Ornithinimicrobium cavernae]
MTAPPTKAPGWRIGRLAGAPVYIGRSWFLVAGVIIVLFGPVVQDALPDLAGWAYLVAGAFAVLLLVSVLVHEAAHALMGQACGYAVNRVVADFWGGHTAYDSRDSTAGRSALVAIVGPLANAALAGVGWLWLSQTESGTIGYLLAAGFTWANGFVAAFNLLPGLPLDGGFLVDSLVWKITGSRGAGMVVAGWSGRLVVVVIAWWLIGRPWLAGQQVSTTSVLWLVVLGGFLWFGASEAIKVGHARQRLEAVRVAQYLTPVSTVPADGPLTALPPPAGQLVLGTDQTGRPVGVLDPAALTTVPREAWPDTRVSAVLQHLPSAWVVAGTPADDMTDVVVALQTDHLPMVALQGPDGHVHGVVRAADL